MKDKLEEYLQSRLRILDKLLNSSSGVVTNDAFEDARILGQIAEVEFMLKYINTIKNEKLCNC
jgi:hypothetical protein